MSILDVFKKSFLDGFSANDINIYTATVAMLITCLLAFYIFIVYRVVTRKTFYCKSFNISLVGVSVVTAGIVLTMQSNIVLSLGMMGALSVVRFRTAVKDPLDLMFLFWAITVGIICGVGLSEIAIILSILLTMGIILLDILPVAKSPILLTVTVSNATDEEKVLSILRKYTKFLKIKAKNMNRTSVDLIIELRTKKGNQILEEVMKIETVDNATLMFHDGETTF